VVFTGPARDAEGNAIPQADLIAAAIKKGFRVQSGDPGDRAPGGQQTQTSNLLLRWGACLSPSKGECAARK